MVMASIKNIQTIRPHIWIMGALFAGAGVIGVLLLPGENERVAMLERDGNNKEALRLLEARFKSGDRAQRTLYQMQRLYEHFGALDKSRRTLEMLAKERPNDAYVQRQLAHFYKATQDEAAYIGALRAQLSIRYSAPACRELIGLLRRKGEYEREERRIETCRKAGYRRPDDLVRLAMLYAVDGKMSRTSQLLQSVDDRRKLKKGRHKIMLFEALLVMNEPEEAQRRGVRWLKGARDDVMALTLLSRLSQEKRYGLAIKMAREVSRPGDSVSLVVADLMLFQDQGVAARSYLRGWLKQASFTSPGVSGRFIHSALDADDVELALAVGRKSDFAKLNQADLALLAIAVASAGKAKQFKGILHFLTPQTVKTHALLAAAVAQSRGAWRRAARLYAKISYRKLNQWEKALLRRLRRGRKSGLKK